MTARVGVAVTETLPLVPTPWIAGEVVDQGRPDEFHGQGSVVVDGGFQQRCDVAHEGWVGLFAV